MFTQQMLHFRSIPHISGGKTTFVSLDGKVIFEVPSALIRRLVELCDGTKSRETVLDLVEKEWDRDSVNAFLEALISKGILGDVRSIHEYTWKAIENPMLFPVGLSQEEVAQKVNLAVTRNRTVAGQEFAPETRKFGELLEQRKSVRHFSEEIPTDKQILRMLWAGYGEVATQEPDALRKTVPSAGALYPLVMHIALLRKTGGLDIGTYRVHYAKGSKVLLDKVSEDISAISRSFLNPTDTLNGAVGVIVISGSFEISGEKYGNRGMLYVPLEAGHVAQNILLQASEDEVATVEIGGFVDKLLSSALCLPESYKPITSIVFGKEDVEWRPEQVGTTLPAQVSWGVPISEKYCPGFSIASVRFSDKRSWSHGRDPSPEVALLKATSEAKEWTSCGCIPELEKGRLNNVPNAVDPRDIIRFNPAQYRVKGFPFAPFDESREYEWAEGFDYTTGSERMVLADLVYFPYFPETPYYAFSNSSGCAAHPDKQNAVQTGTLELVERDAFMGVYLTQLTRPSIDPKTLPRELRKRIRAMNEAGFEVTVKDHSLDLAPVISVIAQNHEMSFTTCAACSSFDAEYATSHAMMEVEASVLSRIQHGNPSSIKPQNVVMPADHGRLYGQKHYYQRADFLLGGPEIDFSIAGKGLACSWDELLGKFKEKGWELVVIPLELSEEYGGNGSLHIVRCVVPGMIPMTFGFRQEPAGVERLFSVAKKLGNTELPYAQLTKFPHPFE